MQKIKTYRIDKLNHTERGLIPLTEKHTLYELPHSFIKNNEYSKIDAFNAATFYDFYIYLNDEDTEKTKIRAIRPNVNFYITQEQYKLLQAHSLI